MENKLLVGKDKGGSSGGWEVDEAIKGQKWGTLAMMDYFVYWL